MTGKSNPKAGKKIEYIRFNGRGFKTLVPTTWLIQATPRHQAVFISPPRKGRAGASVSINLWSRPAGMDMKGLRASLADTRKSTFPTAEVLREQETTLDKRAGYDLLFQYRQPGSKRDVVQRIIMLLAEGVIVSLAVRRSAEKEPELDKALAVIINNFKFR